jgi:hypothetical protein
MEKKQYERICVERFLKAIGRVPTLIEDSEAPDFRVHFNDELVGIEVTKALGFGERGQNTPQAQASLRARVLTKARVFYDSTGAPPLHVSAGFRDDTPITGSRVSQLAKAIADFLQTHASGFEIGEYDLIEPCEFTFSMPEVYSLHFMRVPSPEDGAWAANGFAMCRPADESDFSAIVSRKDKKVASYRSQVPTVWLLVVVELFEAGELVSTDEPSSPYSITTAFDRIFAFHWLTARVSEIPVARRKL